jgi:hypothetical protein
MVCGSVFLLLTGLAYQATAVGCNVLQHATAAPDSEAASMGLTPFVEDYEGCCVFFGEQHLVYPRVLPRFFHVPLHG